MTARAVLLAVVVVLAGCAGSEDISPQATRDLQAHAAAVRAAAEGSDAAAARSELDELRGAVDRWLQSGDLDTDRAREILAAVEDVEGALAVLAPPLVEEPPSPVPEEDIDDDEEPEEAEEEAADEDVEEEADDEDNSGPGSGDADEGDSSGPGSGDGSG